MNKSNGKVDEFMRASVVCPSCSSKNHRKFNGELALHVPGLPGLDRPIVWAFPEVLICLDCGLAVFAIDDAPLQELFQNCGGGEFSGPDNLAPAA